MMIKSPQQELFDVLFKVSTDLKFDTYDIKQMNEVKYPFVEFEYTQEIGVAAKSARLGKIPIVLSVWGNGGKRALVADMAEKIFEKCLLGLTSSNYQFSLNSGASTVTISVDTSTNTPLYRAQLELEFNFS